MPQSITFTVFDKQKTGTKARSPFKLETDKGTFKAWPDVGINIHVGETYHGAIEQVPSTNPEYPRPDTFVTTVTKATDGPNGAGGGRPSPTPAPRLTQAVPPTDWAEIQIQNKTVEMFAAIYNHPEDMTDCLDRCRAAWKAHLGRNKSPAVRPVTMAEMAEPAMPMAEEDWDEFTAT